MVLMADNEPRLQTPRWADRVDKIRVVELFNKYRGRVVSEETGLPFEPTRRAAAYTIERLAFDTGATLRIALRLFVPFCLLLFGVSFAWDFHELIRSCSVAGLIGFSTNWVAIKMLFWPREVRPIFGHGLIPSQRDQLIDKVATEVLKNLINEELILEKIEQTRIVQRFSGAAIDKLYLVTKDAEFKGDVRNLVLTYVGDITANPEFRERLASRLENAIEDFAGERFRSYLVRRLRDLWRGPLIQVVNRELDRLDETLDEGLGEMDPIFERLPGAFEQRREAIDDVLTKMLVGLVREVDIRAIVYEQLSTVTTEQLETGFREFSDDKLSFITILGGVLGLIGGTVIIWPLQSMSVLCAIGAMMAIADLVLQPLTKSRYWPKKGA
jgi:uncharacterized membrane-anchored protein YjiN (DUF445 family)